MLFLGDRVGCLSWIVQHFGKCTSCSCLEQESEPPVKPQLYKHFLLVRNEISQKKEVLKYI